jgi:hypothetical protein
LYIADSFVHIFVLLNRRNSFPLGIALMFRSVKVPYISFMSNTLQQRPALMNRRRRHPSGTRGLHPLRGKRRRTIPGLLASQAPKTLVRGVAQRLTAGVGARRDMLLLIRRQQPAFHGWRTTHTPTHPAYDGACVPSKAVTAVAHSRRTTPPAPP